MKGKVAAIAMAAPLTLMLTTGTTLATSYAAPMVPKAPAQDRYHGSGDLTCVTLPGLDASLVKPRPQAQAILEGDPSNPNGLAAAGEAIACEPTEAPTGDLAFEDGSGFVSAGVRPDTEDGEPNNLDARGNRLSRESTEDASGEVTVPQELPATGGVLALPIPAGPASAGGTALVATALLPLAAKRRKKTRTDRKP
jgi:hypothetical protein